MKLDSAGITSASFHRWRVPHPSFAWVGSSHQSPQGAASPSFATRRGCGCAGAPPLALETWDWTIDQSRRTLLHHDAPHSITSIASVQGCKRAGVASSRPSRPAQTLNLVPRTSSSTISSCVLHRSWYIQSLPAYRPTHARPALCRRGEARLPAPFVLHPTEVEE